MTILKTCSRCQRIAHSNPCRRCTPAVNRAHNADPNRAFHRTHEHKARRRRIFKRDGYKCVTCGSPEDLTLDYVVPLSKGGQRADANSATRCRSCNSAKGART